MAKKKKKLSRFSRILLDIILVVSLGVAAFSGYRLWKETEKYRVGKKAYDDIRDTIIVEPSHPDEDADETVTHRRIDWEALWALNPDFCAWITLEGSTIDYPVIQGSDNSWYLKHLPDGTYNDSGTIFIDTDCPRDFSGRVTVLYGHHMLDDPLMFAEVENYKNQSYYDSHRKFMIFTPEAEYEVYPVAGRVASGTSGYIQLTFADDEEYKAYIQSFMEQSDFVSEETISESDQMVMLSTCSYDIYDGRYVLIGKLKKISSN